MLSGILQLEDLTIQFHAYADLQIRYTVLDNQTHEEETNLAPQAAFLAALAIAVHNDGTPDYRVDYEAAESVQPSNPALRFIP